MPTPDQTAYVAAPDVNAADLVAPVCRAADGAVLGEDDRAPRPIFDAMTDEVASRLVTVPDDRVLNVWEGGDPDGVAVVFRHGTPSGRLQAVLGAEAALLALADTGDVSGALKGFRAQGGVAYDRMLQPPDEDMVAEFVRDAPDSRLVIRPDKGHGGTIFEYWDEMLATLRRHVLRRTHDDERG